MLRNRIYYGLKPFIPQPLRMALRRQLAVRRRPRVSAVSNKLKLTQSGWDSDFWQLPFWYRES